jgi:hypothetical protein
VTLPAHTRNALDGLRAGATGQPAVSDPAEQLAELRRQQRECNWDDATPLIRDAGLAYQEVMGDRHEHERAADAAAREPRGNGFL